MADTKIAWTEKTWNPVRGCSRKSPGCVNCYAERFAARDLPGHRSPTTGNPFAFMTQSGPRWTGKVELIEHMLDAPLHWRKPRKVFVNSMSDLFHESLPFEAIDRVFAVIALCPQHTFQVLTKRADRMVEYFASKRGHLTFEHAQVPARSVSRILPLSNVWLGVSCEDRARKSRIEDLRNTPAAIRFLSLEPLLEDIGDLDLRGIDWVIVGGESGPGARPCGIDWIRSIVQQCRGAEVACFVKQMGANCVDLLGKMNGAMFDRKGGNFELFPEYVRVRQYPDDGRTA